MKWTKTTSNLYPFTAGINSCTLAKQIRNNAVIIAHNY